jgi:4-hydroxyphenylpyruvate dioxygenase
MVQTGARQAPGGADFLPLQAVDYIEFYVGNARQAAHFYRTGFGFDVVAYAGPETGVRDHASYLLQQGEIRFLLTAALTPDHPIARHVALHGDGVHDIALRVPDAATAYRETTSRGAGGVTEPHEVTDACGTLQLSAVAAYGDTIHTFVQRHGYSGLFMPGFEPLAIAGSPTGIYRADHLVANVELGAMDEWVRYYAAVMGFTQLIHYDDKDISTEYSALMSKVMQGGAGRIKFPINEPAEGRKKSQIQEYLDFYRGPGVQHIALLTDDIIGSVTALRRNGIDFLSVPETYYEDLPSRVGHIEEPLKELARLGILVDRDDEGYLLQIFTNPVQDRPTVFFEVIQRKGSQGFGKGNFKALFEAIERAQERRGNL